MTDFPSMENGDNGSVKIRNRTIAIEVIAFLLIIILVETAFIW